MVFSALGGVGMGTQDTVCPVILMRVFPTHYPSAMGAGQAFFSAGCFLPPLTMGVLLANDLPYYYTYYIFAGLCAVMLLLLPLVKLPRNSIVKEPDSAGGGPAPGSAAGKTTQPADNAAKRDWTAVLLLAVICVSYCALTNTINLYTASYADFLGISDELSVSVLASYNMGCMAGSLLFAYLLRRVKPATLLCMNLAAAFCCLLLSLCFSGFTFMMVCYFLMGSFLGVIFSIMVAISISLWQGRAGRAGAAVALLGGGADIAAPLLTGAVITLTGIRANIWFIVVFLTLSLTGALLLRRRITSKQTGETGT